MLNPAIGIESRAALKSGVFWVSLDWFQVSHPGTGILVIHYYKPSFPKLSKYWLSRTEGKWEKARGGLEERCVQYLIKTGSVVPPLKLGIGQDHLLRPRTKSSFRVLSVDLQNIFWRDEEWFWSKVHPIQGRLMYFILAQHICKKEVNKIPVFVFRNS
jgi:hypothetical protein